MLTLPRPRMLLFAAAVVTAGAYLVIVKHPRPTGLQRVAILLIDDDFVTGTQSRDDLEHQLTDLSNPSSFASMLKRASNGHFDFQGDVFPPAGQGHDWYTYHGPEGFQSGDYVKAAQLADDDVDFKQYDRVMVLVPHTTGHAGGPGLVTLFTDEGDIKMPCSMSRNGNLVHAWPASSGASADTFLMGHEFGHTIAKDVTDPTKFQISHQMTLTGLGGAIYAPSPDASNRTMAASGSCSSSRRIRTRWSRTSWAGSTRTTWSRFAATASTRSR